MSELDESASSRGRALPTAKTLRVRSLLFLKLEDLPYVIPDIRLTMLPPSDDYNLIIRQGPERAKVAGPKEKGITTKPTREGMY